MPIDCCILDLLVIKEEVEKDVKLKEIIKKSQNEDVADYSLQQGILKYKNRVVISKSLTSLSTILHTYHDSVLGAHSRYLRTYKHLMGKLYLEGIKGDVKKHCKECVV